MTADEPGRRVAAAANLRDAAMSIDAARQKVTVEECVKYLLDRADQIEQGGYFAYPVSAP